MEWYSKEVTRPVKTAPRTKRSHINAVGTRAHIIESARTLFIRDGYAPTTLAKIAAEAGVVSQTVYNAVGNKAAVLMAVFERVISGPQAPRSVPEFMRERVGAASSPQEVVSVLAAWFVEAHRRTGRLWQVIAEAGTHDPEMQAFARTLAHRRLRNYGEAAEDLARRGAPGRGLDPEGVAAVIWSIGHPQVFQTLVVESGWSHERYRKWVRAALLAAVGLSVGRASSE